MVNDEPKTQKIALVFLVLFSEPPLTLIVKGIFFGLNNMINIHIATKKCVFYR